jgi:putative addiction module component (TIGR02574 family)
MDIAKTGRYGLEMSKALENILSTAAKLSTAERAELVAALLASLDGDPEEAVDAAWVAEIQRRIERVRAGAPAGRPWPEVRERLARRRG